MKKPVKGRHSLLRTYLKDLSFKQLQPAASPEPEKPVYEVELSADNENLERDMWAVVLGVAITALDENEQAVYKLSLKQVGLFHVEGHSLDIRDQILNIHFPAMLYDYARASVDSTLNSAGLPTLILDHRNFNAIYQQARQDSLGIG